MALEEKDVRQAPERGAFTGVGLVKGLAVTMKHLLRRSVTQQYPEVKPDLPARTRGVIALKQENCTVCYKCSRECPDWCIYIDAHKETHPPASGGKARSVKVLDRFAIDYSLCMYCGICVEVCPFDALFWSPEFEYAGYDIQELVHEKEKLEEWTYTVLPPPALEDGAVVAGEVAAATPAPAPAPAAGAPAAPAAGEHKEVSIDQETYDRVFAELIAKGTTERVAQGQARRAAMIAARQKAGGETPATPAVAPEAAPAAEAVAEAPAPEAAPAPEPAPAAPAAEAEHKDVSIDQETYERVLAELIAKGTTQRVAQGQARRAAMIAARKKAAGGSLT